MGDLLYRGDGMPADPAAAWAYLRLAEQAGFPDASGYRQEIEPQLDTAARQRAVRVLQDTVAAFHKEAPDE
jgi:TPR repeat protein